jgi:hypothetical protein
VGRVGEVMEGRVRVAAVAFVLAVVVWLCVCSWALAAGDVDSVECPLGSESSPGFHPYLGDCRAFELVTPPFINGAFPAGVGGKAEPPQVSADGDHLLSLVLGGFAETESLEQNTFHYGAYYEYSRTPGGWSAEALTPPASLFPRFEFVFASADFSRSLWKGQEAAGGEELPVGPPAGGTTASSNGFTYPNNAVIAVRDAVGGGKGRFTVVGPLTAPGHEPDSKEEGFEVEGASADLSHVLLRVNDVFKQLWPGDETSGNGAPSLYEYVGTGDREPVLVGVRNEGSVAEVAAREGKVYVNEAAELVSHCGTALGGGSAGGRFANAVSQSGETVYFTALACGGGPSVNELYARVGGARTVDISEPTTGPGGDCERCEESEPYAAVYQGASEDGSRVFFTSEQELLPGARGDSLYEYDFDAADPHARVTLLAPEIANVAAVSEDASHLYFESPLVLAANANGNGEVAQAGAQNLYLCYAESGGAPVFVAREANGVRATRDGQYVVFESSRHVAGTNDRSGVVQLFEYDALTGVIVRVSVGQRSPAGYECETTHVIEEGFNCDGNVTSGSFYLPFSLAEQEREKWEPTDATSGLAVSANGVVEFESEVALTPLAVRGKENVYEFEAGDVYLVSPGTEATSPVNREGSRPLSRALGVDESGQNLFFSTTESLLVQDGDSQTSWYDARVDGGFPAPPERPTCSPGSCQGPLSAAPLLPVAGGTATAVAGGNLVPQSPVVVASAKPVAKCKKGFVRKKGRCVRQAKGKAGKASVGRARGERGVGS